MVKVCGRCFGKGFIRTGPAGDDKQDCPQCGGESCEWWLHDISQCGDPAIGSRLGFMYCAVHMDRHDALSSIERGEQ